MNKLITLLAAFALVTLARADTPREKAEDRLQRAAEVLQQIMNAPDKGIPEEVVKNAKCIAVVPHEIKGGFIVGARGGEVASDALAGFSVACEHCALRGRITRWARADKTLPRGLRGLAIP